MDRKMVSKIQNINDGISAGSGIVSLAVPEFVATPLIVFAVNRILGLISDEDIIKRLKKIEKQLETKKISKEDFKNKIIDLSEHKKYFSTTVLENIIKNCIPETVDIYISLFIDYIMQEKCEVKEELCEIISSLNKHDLDLIKYIKKYLRDGEGSNYKQEIKRLEESDKRNAEIEMKNKIIEEENKNNPEKISKLTIFPFRDRSIILDEKRTIFWNDFSIYCGFPNPIPLNFTMLYEYYDKNTTADYSDWIFYGKSFIKLERIGILQLDYKSTLGTINSLDISRFHITILGLVLLEYIEI